MGTQDFRARDLRAWVRVVDELEIAPQFADPQSGTAQSRDEHDPGQRGGVITPAPIRLPRRADQPYAFVIAQRVRGDAGPFGHFRDAQRPIRRVGRRSISDTVAQEGTDHV